MNLTEKLLKQLLIIKSKFIKCDLVKIREFILIFEMIKVFNTTCVMCMCQGIIYILKINIITRGGGDFRRFVGKNQIWTSAGKFCHTVHFSTLKSIWGWMIFSKIYINEVCTEKKRKFKDTIEEMLLVFALESVLSKIQPTNDKF